MLLLATSDDPARRDASDAEASEPDASAPEPSADPSEYGELEPTLLPQESLSSASLDDAEASDPDDAEALPQDDPLAPTPEPDAARLEEHDAVQLEEQTPSTAAEPTRPEPPPAVKTTLHSKPGHPERSPLQRVVLAVLVIAAAALIGYVLSRPSGREADADALVRSIDAAGRLQLRLETDAPAEARSYIREEFGWRVGVPVFEAIPLRGVAIAQTAPAVEVPVFLYADAEGRNVAVFAYSYALLDQVPDRLRLTATDYAELDRGSPFVRRADGTDVVVWRDRDDIYVAVTDLPPDVLTDGFAMAR